MRPRFHRRRYANSVYTSVAGVSPFTRNIQLERYPELHIFPGQTLRDASYAHLAPHFHANCRVVVSRQKFPALRSFEPDRDLTRTETPPIVEQETPSVTWKVKTRWSTCFFATVRKTRENNERDNAEQNVNPTCFCFQTVRTIYRTMKLRRSITVRNKCDLGRRTTSLRSSDATSDIDNLARSFVYRAANRNLLSR